MMDIDANHKVDLQSNPPATKYSTQNHRPKNFLYQAYQKLLSETAAACHLKTQVGSFKTYLYPSHCQKNIQFSSESTFLSGFSEGKHSKRLTPTGWHT
jgi:hypothetical protein